MLKSSFLWLAVLVSSSSASAADCVYEGKSYSRGAVVCVPNTATSLTCEGPEASQIEWVRKDADDHCTPGACLHNERLYSEGAIYTRKEVTIRCDGGKWVPN